MLIRTPRNLHYVRRLLKLGHSADAVAARIAESYVWDGPFPTEMDIRRFIRTSATPDAGKGSRHCRQEWRLPNSTRRSEA